MVTGMDLYPEPPEKIDTKFLLYTRRIRWDPFVLDYLDNTTVQSELFDDSVPLIIIIHGMNERGTNDWINATKDAILEKDDVNVVAVDWGKGCPLPFYSQGIVNAELVGRQLANLLTSIVNIRNYDIAKTYIIGFSLGGQLAGFTAKILAKDRLRIGRITGLDPAGPFFEDKSELVYLNYFDADYVDIIHTSGGKEGILKGNFGMTKATGHSDFFPNGGSDQPGCGILEIVCSHRRAYQLFLESIQTNCHFTAIACTSYEQYQEGLCLERKAYLGYYSSKSTAAQQEIFYLRTYGTSPYCIY